MTSVRISVRNLVEFILRSGDIDDRRGQGGSPEAMLEGAKIHRAIQAAAGSDYSAEVSLSEEIQLTDEVMLVIDGRADGVINNKGYITIDEIKGMYLDVLKLTEPFEIHLAQAKCYAYIWARQHGLSDISVRMTYVGIEDRHIKLFNSDHTFEELEGWFRDLTDRYKPWALHIAGWTDTRRESVKKLEFPYEYRPGQRDLAADVYKTIYHRKKLFLEAPTGTGKTLAVLFPSIKATGEGLASYIFYMTAKNMGAKACADALELMRERGGLRFKSVHILGKERSCLNTVSHCNPDECLFARGHFDRVNEALYELLTSKDAFTREEIEKQSVKHQVCPYALARDLTEFSDCIICDYNYIFDPAVSLRHFFGEGKKTGDYLFLIDEAHNLVERARDMYSASLSLRRLGYVSGLIRGIDRKLSRCLNVLIGQMEILADELTEAGIPKDGYMIVSDIGGVMEAAGALAGRFLELMQERRHRDGDSDSRGRRNKGDEDPGQLTLADTCPTVVNQESAGSESVEPGADQGEEKSGRKADRFSDEILEFYFDLLHFGDVCDRLDMRYRIYTERTESGDMQLRLLCVDPSHNLSEYLAYGRATVFFSATLLPVSYYMDLLVGSRDDYTVYAFSVFDPDKLGVFVDTAVTSRYARRGPEEYRKIAIHIKEIVSCRKGNYMVFFPSYSFLEKVYEMFGGLTDNNRLYDTENAGCDTEGTEAGWPDAGSVICQTAEMSEQDREDFLGRFAEGDNDGIIAFCVMGGLFAEGIDLTGEKLIGALIVGTGLPQISNERDILKKYFNDNGRDGFDYSMKIPGMNKVLQAAGRVIRTEEDTGVIALLDERFDKPDHRKMYPREWRKIQKITGREFDLIRKFWSDHVN